MVRAQYRNRMDKAGSPDTEFPQVAAPGDDFWLSQRQSSLTGLVLLWALVLSGLNLPLPH